MEKRPRKLEPQTPEAQHETSVSDTEEDFQTHAAAIYEAANGEITWDQAVERAESTLADFVDEE